jgi:putative ABC transport system permease protein
MTLLDEHPVATEPPTPVAPVPRSALPAWRFASRLARREVRRRPGRTALAALLIAVPVVAMTIGSVLARTNARDWAADFERDYGDTDIAINGYGYANSGPTAGDSGVTSLAAGSDVRDYVFTPTAVTSATADVRDRTAWVRFGNMSFDDPGAVAGIEITAGRAPGAGEVLLDPDVADRWGLDVGDQLELARPTGSWTVAALGTARGDYWTDLMIVPGFDATRVSTDYGQPMTLIDLPADTPIETIRQIAAERGGVTRYDDPFTFERSGEAAGMAWGFVAGVLALVAVGIIVAAAFATSARRQLVTIGQLSSNGAPESVIRRTLALQGAWTGVVGALGGIVIGFIALPFVTPLIERHIVHHQIRAYRVSVVDLAVIAITAIVAATVAAAVPARSAARVPVMTALAGRRPTGAPSRWLVPTGLALLGGGLGLVAVAALGAQGDTQSSDVWAALAIIGVTAMVFGMCCTAPLVVERVGGLGRRATLSWRLALRSLARSRTRSSAVVAAIAVAVGGAVAAGAVAESVITADGACCPAEVPADAVVFAGWQYVETVPDPDGWDDVGPLRDVDIPDDAMSGILAIAPGAEVSPIQAATFDPAPFDPAVDWNEPHGPLIATPALLDLIGMSKADRATLAEVGALQPTSVVGYAADAFYVADGPGLEDTESDLFQAQYRADGGVIEVPYATAADPVQHGWNLQLLITERAASDAGFSIVQTGVIVRAGSPLTEPQRDELALLAREFDGTPIDAFIEPGDPPRTEATYQTGMLDDTAYSVQYDEPRRQQSGSSDLWIARLVIVGAALALVLLVVSIGLALAAAEGREERDSFAIVGARPSSMRRQAAARAAVLALVGLGLGVPLGFVPTWVVDRVTRNAGPSSVDAPIGFPWLVVVTLIVAIPAVVAGAAWAASGLGQRFRPANPTRRD